MPVSFSAEARSGKQYEQRNFELRIGSRVTTLIEDKFEPLFHGF
jgi:hypothetical protein